MQYIKEKIKDGVMLHLIINENFKTDFTVVFLSLPLKKENISSSALIPAVLKSGSKKFLDYKQINEELEMLYGAAFECGIDKTGDNLVLKFYIESINDLFLPEKNNNLEKVIDILFEIIFNPQIEKEGFVEKYIELEKKKLETLINSRKDDKDLYSYEKCINIMYKNSGYGLSKYGEIKDLNNINERNLYEKYKELINNCKIDIIISGNFDKTNITEKVLENSKIKNLNPRKNTLNKNNYQTEIKEKTENPNIVHEEMEVSQGKLVLGLDILPNDLGDFRFIATLYNAILGNGVNSKLFQIVREKESLAYKIKSEYITRKNNIIIKCGIEDNNYEKTLLLINKILDDLKQGKIEDDELEKAKEFILAGIDSINEEQDSQILFLFGQELSDMPLTVEEYKENIKNVKKQDIIRFANYISTNTIYFLKSGGENADN